MKKLIFFFVLGSAFYSCINIEESNYNGKSPRYQFVDQDSLNSEMHKYRFFWVKNYALHKKIFHENVLEIMCESIIDSIQLTKVDLEFAVGSSKWDIQFVAHLEWFSQNPNEVIIHNVINSNSKKVLLNCN